MLCLSLDAVLCRPAVLPVVQVLSFLVPCFWTPPFSWCLLYSAVLVYLRRCSLCGALSSLWRWLLLCVGACCVWVLAVGPGCPVLSLGGSWWLLVLCSGGAVPVWPRGLPPSALVWCVLVLCSLVLCSVVLCYRVMVCCCALLCVWVVACACCFFRASKTSALPLEMFSSPPPFLKIESRRKRTHPRAARPRILCATYVLPAFGRALRLLLATAMEAMLYVLLPVVASLMFARG